MASKMTDFGSNNNDGFYLDGFDLHDRLEGGMAYVFKAYDHANDRIVAVKVLKPHFCSDPVNVERFVREAEVLSKLNHHGIVRFYNSGEKKDSQGCTWYYMVLEWLDGTSLDQIVKNHRDTNRYIDVSDIVNLTIPLCNALQHAHTHSERIVHRDLKPSNVMLLRSDYSVPVLMDFGIAYIQTNRKLTQQFQLVGSAEYMSPEHASSKSSLDPRSDLYSLGIVMYEMATGDVPFPDLQGNPVSVLASHIQQKPVPPKEKRPDLPDWLNNIILRLLEKNPDNRFNSASEVAESLQSQSIVQHSAKHTLGLRSTLFEDEDLKQVLEDQRSKLPSMQLVPTKRTPAAVFIMAGMLLTIFMLAVIAGILFLSNKPYEPSIPSDMIDDAIREFADLRKLDSSEPLKYPDSNSWSSSKYLYNAVRVCNDCLAFDNNTVLAELDRKGSVDMFRNSYNKTLSYVENVLLRQCVQKSPANRYSMQINDKIKWNDIETILYVLNVLNSRNDKRYDEKLLGNKLKQWQSIWNGNNVYSANGQAVSGAIQANNLWDISKSVNSDKSSEDVVRKLKQYNTAVTKLSELKLLIDKTLIDQWQMEKLTGRLAKAKETADEIDDLVKNNNLDQCSLYELKNLYTNLESVKKRIDDLFEDDKQQYVSKVSSLKIDIEKHFAVEKDDLIKLADEEIAKQGKSCPKEIIQPYEKSFKERKEQLNGLIKDKDYAVFVNTFVTFQAEIRSLPDDVRGDSDDRTAKLKSQLEKIINEYEEYVDSLSSEGLDINTFLKQDEIQQALADSQKAENDQDYSLAITGYTKLQEVVSAKWEIWKSYKNAKNLFNMQNSLYSANSLYLDNEFPPGVLKELIKKAEDYESLENYSAAAQKYMELSKELPKAWESWTKEKSDALYSEADNLSKSNSDSDIKQAIQLCDLSLEYNTNNDRSSDLKKKLYDKYIPKITENDIILTGFTINSEPAIRIKWPDTLKGNFVISYANNKNEPEKRLWEGISTSSYEDKKIVSRAEAGDYNYYYLFSVKNDFGELTISKLVDLKELFPGYLLKDITLSHEVNDDSIQLKWNSVSNAEYSVKRKKTGENSWTELTGIKTAAGTCSIEDTLASSGKYTYQVFAKNDLFSRQAEIDVKWEFKLDPPVNLKVEQSDKGYLKISWDASDRADKYMLYKSGSSTGTKKELTGGLSALSYDDSDIKTNEKYYYWVKAVNEKESVESEFSELTLGSFKASECNQLSKPDIELISKGKGNYTLRWKPVLGATRYRIYYYQEKNQNKGSFYYELTSGTSIDISKDNPVEAKWDKCYFWVVAVNENTKSDDSETEYVIFEVKKRKRPRPPI